MVIGYRDEHKNDCGYQNPFKHDGIDSVPRHDSISIDFYHKYRDKIIRQKAYFIWLKEGKPDNKEIENWLAAEKDYDENLVKWGVLGI